MICKNLFQICLGWAERGRPAPPWPQSLPRRHQKLTGTPCIYISSFNLLRTKHVLDIFKVLLIMLCIRSIKIHEKEKLLYTINFYIHSKVTGKSRNFVSKNPREQIPRAQFCEQLRGGLLGLRLGLLRGGRVRYLLTRQEKSFAALDTYLVYCLSKKS